MVSFQCEACADVLTKKKLDAHRSHCYGASFSCLDCSTHFRGSDYRSHTKVLGDWSEANRLSVLHNRRPKISGALYREKPAKASKRKSVSIVEPNDHKALVPRAAFVEDAPDIDAPPHVPSPPPAVPALPANIDVFDFLVTEDTPDTSKVSLSPAKEQMSMKKNAPSVFVDGKENVAGGYRNSEEQLNTREYEEHGYSYGAEPVNPRPFPEVNGSLVSLEYMTPAAKATKAKLDKKERPIYATHSRTDSGTTSEKKRKRGLTEDHANANGVTHYELEGDTLMPDAPETVSRSAADTPTFAHSGLTGGLNRLMSEDHPFPPSPEYEKERERERDRNSRPMRKQEDPASPLKRTRHTKDEPRHVNGPSNGLGISIKGRAGKVMSLVGGGSISTALAALANPAAAQNEGMNRETALVKTRRRASSSDHTHSQSQSRSREGEKREKKKHRVHRHNGTSSSNVRYERRGSRRSGYSQSPEDDGRHLKAIEYHKADESGSDSDNARHRNGNSQMVVFGAEEQSRLRCESFLSFVTKGPDSEKGCSVNKALKRWHREADLRSSSAKQEEEKELWRGLRLKKNDRNEIVVFF